MILVDTSIWISHFKKAHTLFMDLLNQNKVMSHPLIIGELACGNLNNRKVILDLLQKLPMAVMVQPDEVLFFIEAHKLMGRGIGLIDTHILASAKLMHVPLWTFDKSLNKASKNLKLAYT